MIDDAARQEAARLFPKSPTSHHLTNSVRNRERAAFDAGAAWQAAQPVVAQTPCCPPKERIEGHWLVEEHKHCTRGCESGYGHQPGCRLVPLVDLRALEGWVEPVVVTAEQVDAAARALYERSMKELGWAFEKSGRTPLTWVETTPAGQHDYVMRARTVLAALGITVEANKITPEAPRGDEPTNAVTARWEQEGDDRG